MNKYERLFSRGDDNIIDSDRAYFMKALAMVNKKLRSEDFPLLAIFLFFWGFLVS